MKAVQQDILVSNWFLLIPLLEVLLGMWIIFFGLAKKSQTLKIKIFQLLI